MTTRPIDVVAAGHICLDVIPQLTSRHRRAEDLFTPGALTQVGPAKLALGGSVANTGLALERLGAKTRLVGKVGDDLLGKAILESLGQVDPSIAENMIIAAGEPTSYTIVLSPPNVDRGFLHCPGTNESFTAADLAGIAWHDTRILHFGYPPLMRGTFADEGLGLAAQFDAAQRSGALVSLDMAAPNSDGTNWRRWLRNVLPKVDIFLPSLDEIQFMLGRPHDGHASDESQPNGQAASNSATISPSMLAEFADELLGLGVPIVVIKLGDQGLYLQTNESVSKLRDRAAWSDFDWHAWRGRKLHGPCFDVEVVGTTGSGDCTIAGFLMAMLHGAAPEQALRLATAVGAHCVKSADATSNIPTWSQVEARLQSPWPHRPPVTVWPGWKFSSERGVYVGPEDASSVAKATS